MKTGVTILIADDDRLIRESVTELLESRGFRVFAAKDGVDAVAAYRRVSPDVVILDVMMP